MLVRDLSALRESLADRSGSWKEMMDPASGATYYLDLDTGHSQWNRPGEMDATSDEVASVTCAICLDICSYPASCRNGHLYCTECLRAHLEVSANSTCPTCRVLIQRNDDGESYGVRNMLAESLAKRLRKAGAAAGDDDDDDRHHSRGSRGKETEEELLARVAQERLQDLRDLELHKRELSNGLKKRVADMRRDFEGEWERKATAFQAQL